MIKKILSGISVCSMFFGIAGMAGSIENDGNFIAPLLMFVIGTIFLFIFGREDEVKVHDCTHHSDDTFRPTFLH